MWPERRGKMEKSRSPAHIGLAPNPFPWPTVFPRIFFAREACAPGCGYPPWCWVRFLGVSLSLLDRLAHRVHELRGTHFTVPQLSAAHVKARWRDRCMMARCGADRSA